MHDDQLAELSAQINRIRGLRGCLTELEFFKDHNLEEIPSRFELHAAYNATEQEKHIHLPSTCRKRLVEWLIGCTINEVMKAKEEAKQMMERILSS